MAYSALNISDKTLDGSVQLVRSYARDVMQNLIDIHFTDHGIGHLERILEAIDLLLKQNDMQELLCEREKYILMCSVLLHDIGMQLEATESEPKLRRDQHHKLTSEIIFDRWKEIGLHEDLVKFVALVSEGHRGNIDERYAPQTLGTSGSIRCDLLAALLCLGEASS